MAHACVLGSHIKGHIMWYGSDSNTDVTLGVRNLIQCIDVFHRFGDVRGHGGQAMKERRAAVALHPPLHL